MGTFSPIIGGFQAVPGLAPGAFAATSLSGAPIGPVFGGVAASTVQVAADNADTLSMLLAGGAAANVNYFAAHIGAGVECCPAVKIHTDIASTFSALPGAGGRSVSVINGGLDEKLADIDRKIWKGQSSIAIKLLEEIFKGPGVDRQRMLEWFHQLIAKGDSGAIMEVLIRATDKIYEWFERGSTAAYREGEVLRAFMKSENELTQRAAAFAYGPLNERFEVDSPEAYKGAKAMRRLMMTGHLQTKATAAYAYGELSAVFSAGSPEIYREGAALRSLMKRGDIWTRKVAANAYEELIDGFEIGSSEVVQGAKILRWLMVVVNEKETRKAAADAYKALSERFKIGSPEVYEEGAAMRDLMLNGRKGVEDTLAEAYAELSERFEDGSSEAYQGGKVLRALMKNGDEITKLAAAKAYGKLSERFEPGSPEVYKGAKALVKLMVSENGSIEFDVAKAYEKLSERFEVGAIEVYKGAKYLRKYIELEDETAIITYGKLSERFAIGSAEAYEGAKLLRKLILLKNHCWIVPEAVDAYGILSSRFEVGSTEVYEGAKLLRDIMLDTSRLALHETANDNAAYAYGRLSARFEVGSKEVYEGANVLRNLMEKADEELASAAQWAYKELFNKFSLKDVGLKDEFDMLIHSYISFVGIDNPLEDILRKGFHFFKQAGLWPSVFEGVADPIMYRLKALTSDNYVKDSFNSWMALLTFVSTNRSIRGRRVLEGIFKGGGKAKKIMRAIKALNNTPSALRNRVNAAIEVKMSKWIRESREDRMAPIPATRVVELLHGTLLDYLRSKVGGDSLILKKEKPEGIDVSVWARVSLVRSALQENDTLSLLASAASFMDESGVESIRKLIARLDEAVITENGRIVDMSRYEELVKEHGFTKEFVDKWSKEYRRTVATEFDSTDVASTRLAIIKMSIRQIGTHAKAVKQVGNGSNGLPGRVSDLLLSLESGNVDEVEVDRLFNEFSARYQDIRRNYGDAFAGIKDDLKVLSRGLSGRMKITSSAVVEFTGSVDGGVKIGTEPVETCQRLTLDMGDGLNREGQPINKILHGQFKFANYIADGVVAARMVVEVTKDQMGKELLLVDHEYLSGQYLVNSSVFKEEIYRYAETLGIDRMHVIFSEDNDYSRNVTPLLTGDVIYRDTWGGEKPVPADGN